MNNLRLVFGRLVRDEEGQDMIEYALLAAFISIVAVTAITDIGEDVNAIYGQVVGATTSAAAGGGAGGGGGS